PQRRLSQLDSGRQIQIALTSHPTVGRVHADRAVPHLREPGNPGNLSTAAQRWADGDDRESGRDRVASRSHDLPQSLVLQPYPPQAHAGEATGLSLAYERLQARRVAEPHGVAWWIRDPVRVPAPRPAPRP